MTASIRLSICIATYNRADFLATTVDFLMLHMTREVEIVVVDGASTDNTKAILETRANLATNFRFICLQSKGGVDQDFNRAVEFAHGDYCWLMSDDDLIKPGAIGAVLTALAASPSLIIVNAEVWKPDFSKMLEPSRLGIGSDRSYLPSQLESLFCETVRHLSFIGAIVIRRSLWLERDKECYFGTEFAHVGVIFQRPLPEKALVVAFPWIMIRHGGWQWSERAFEIWAFKWPNILWSLPAIPERCKSIVSPRYPWKSARMLLVERARGTYTLSQYRRLLRPGIVSLKEKLVAWLIAILPGAIINMLLVAYFSTFRPELHTLLWDLRNRRFSRGQIGRTTP